LRDYVELAKRQLDTFGLLEQLDSLAEGLSYGQQKLLAISRLLLGSFDVFLLDEPFSGVNPGMVSRIQEVIQELAHKQKIVVIIEHDMHVVRSISDWSFFLFEGTILASGTPDHVLADADVRKAYLLL